jgi:putative membrane protein
MSYNIALFLHIVGVATWFGAMHILAIWLGRTAKTAAGEPLAETLQTVHRLNVRTLVPSALIVLLTGTYMLVSGWEEQPFCLLFKERFGGLFILVYIAVFTLYGRKMVRSASESSDTESLRRAAKRYTVMAHVTTLFILIVMLFATLKFS